MTTPTSELGECSGALSVIAIAYGEFCLGALNAAFGP